MSVRYIPDTLGGTPIPGDCPPTGIWDEDAFATDEPVIGVIFPVEDVVSQDSVGPQLIKLAEDASISDEWSTEIDGTWQENANVGDNPVFGTILSEDAEAADSVGPQLVKLADDADVADALALTGTITQVRANVNDRSIHQIIAKYGRSATPDTDPGGDAYTNQSSPDTNNGAINQLEVKGNQTLMTNERRAYFKIDMTKFGDFVALDGNEILFRADSLDTLSNNTLNWDIRSVTTDPFTESTVTWNIPPTLGISRQTGTISIPPGAPAFYTIVPTAATLGFMLGNWMLIVFTGVAAALPQTIRINSRENSTDANRWQWTFNLQRGT